MDYLRLINTFRHVSGSRDLFVAPCHGQPLLSVDLERSDFRSHFVLDSKLCKQILLDTEGFAQDRFLNDLLQTCDPDRCHWVKFFVDESPEFLDGQIHRVRRHEFDARIRAFRKSIEQASPTEISSIIRQSCEQASAPSTLQLAQSIVRLRFEQILRAELNRHVQIPTELLFGPEIFTPSARIKSNVYRLNELTSEFMSRYVDDSLLSKKDHLLAILSLFYMASSPIVAGITSLLNEYQRERMIREPGRFVNYQMVPTNFVAREAIRSTVLGSEVVQPGDKVYLFLFEHSGCPFRAGVSLPFGHGKHLCPGAGIAKLLMEQCLEACQHVELTLWDRLRCSELRHGLPAAFLTFH